MHDFYWFTILEAIKLALKAITSALELCFVREIEVDQFLRLLHLVISTFFVTFRPFFHFRTISPQFQHFRASKSQNVCRRLFQGLRLPLNHFSKGWTYAARVLKPKKAPKKLKNLLFLRKVCFRCSKAFHRVSLHFKKSVTGLLR